jgi:hypothetical protein
MNLRTTTLALPDGGTLTLTLPESPTPAGIARLNAAIDSYLRTLSRDLVGAGADDAAALEVDSWTLLRH